MKKRLIPIVILVVYSAILVNIIVFKNVPTIRIGHLMLNFGGREVGHSANFVPFKTIMLYLFGYRGSIIAAVNLIGNIALLVPIGFLVPLVYRTMTWKKTIVLAVISGLVIETMQAVLHVGIFDIDDVILNALGVLIGYGVFLVLMKWVRERKYRNIIVAAILIIAAVGVVLYCTYPKNQQLVSPGSTTDNTIDTHIIFPQGNEALVVGQSYVLKWSGGQPDMQIFLIDVAAKSVGVSVSSVDRIYHIPNTGSYTYTIPTRIQPGIYQFEIGDATSNNFQIIAGQQK